ncbi:glycosyltransferase [Pseudomonas vlassakiae]|jgi:glycosyltransferase involved in cell wall biosynthesis|uniref:glycosyltransferase n=1 Tax=Pseudomonas TaxID=286 RepID=UPI0006D3F1AF|nr:MULTISPECIES: glycosyltransferase [Pseudomonas]AXQ48071.1 colanic acid biosynthesis glycosyltransferase WcaL [Stenotrophomonas rhizophila]MBS3184980.1 glycosyltransferase [Pseudomonas sp. PCH44]MCU0125314.1 glycosyltransferase [Pseudomonas vlassakiae]PIK79646.1 colanic acid biosynthesis glycosyltransferase WcaL [Pseudomonas sp. 382]HCV39616.1 colanic acid biosynthesis glycosyltransferase WcaL [Pseudomonas sp.]
MRIAYFINQYPKVSHSFIRREIQALERQGIEVQRIALRGWDAELHDPEDLAERGKTRYVLEQGLKGLLRPLFDVVRAQPKRFLGALRLALRLGWRADRPWPYHVVYLAEACRLLQWLQASAAEHVHAHFGTNSTEVVMLANALGGPAYSFTVHGPEEFDKAQILHLGEKVRRAAFVAAVSSFGRSQLYRWVAHEHWDKVKVVHCGLERSFHEGVALAPPAAPRLVCVGRLCEQKGQLLLVEAARALASRGVDFKLVLAGDGEMRGPIEALIARYGLQAQVRITGWISSAQVRDEILAARALVLPSFAEGLPVVIMEAMALRRPVLTTYVAGIPELVCQGDNGWLFAAGSVEALTEAMLDSLQQPVEVLQRMGEAACQRVLERHDIDTEAARLVSHFRGPTC